MGPSCFPETHPLPPRLPEPVLSASSDGSMDSRFNHCRPHRVHLISTVPIVCFSVLAVCWEKPTTLVRRCGRHRNGCFRSSCALYSHVHPCLPPTPKTSTDFIFRPPIIPLYLLSNDCISRDIPRGKLSTDAPAAACLDFHSTFRKV